MDTVVAELVSFFQALKGGSPIACLISVATVLMVLALLTVAVVYHRIRIKRSETAAREAQENFEAIAADLRKRALGVKERDDDLRQREHEARKRDNASRNRKVGATERNDDLEGFFKVTNTELKFQPQRPQRQLQALRESVSHIIMLGLSDIQTRLLETDFKGMMSAVPSSQKADLQGWAGPIIRNQVENPAAKRVFGKKYSGNG